MKRGMIKISVFTLSIIMLFTSSIYAIPVTEIPEIGAVTGIVIDKKTGLVIYNKYMDTPMEPASTTKIMTAMLALEKLDLKKEVKIDSETPYTEGSRIYLTEGEIITVENLLYAMMTESANDCAVALAKEISGSVPEFVKLMNKRAKKLGANNTHFVNPNGLHIDGHYSTARDLALIANEAMKNPKFRQLVMTYKWTVPATNKQPVRYLYNTNRLIYDTKHKVTVRGQAIPCKYNGVTGIKTGYTSHAGACLVSGAARGNEEWIAVVLKTTDMGRYADSITLLDFAFSHYRTVKLKSTKDSLGKISIDESKEGKYNIYPKEAVYGTVEKGKKTKSITTKTVVKKDLKAPLKKGTTVGRIEVYDGKNCINKVDLIIKEPVQRSKLAALGINMPLWKLFFILSGLIIIAIILFILYRTYKINKKKKRLRRENEKARRKRQKEDNWPY